MLTPVIVTTSWDDGDPADLKIAELLAAQGLSGTFYIPVKAHHTAQRLTSSDLRSLARMGFEIGGHGVSHPDLTLCNPAELACEVGCSKKQLENELGRAVWMFAYPKGRCNGKVISSLKQAGYWGARTTRMLARGINFDPFQMPTSLQAYPHSWSAYLRNLGRAFSVGRATEYFARLPESGRWVDLAKGLFDAVLREGGVWHLYGHSWEVDELQLWSSLEEIFSYVAMRPGVLYLSNSNVLRLLPQESCQSSLANNVSSS